MHSSNATPCFDPSSLLLPTTSYTPLQPHNTQTIPSLMCITFTPHTNRTFKNHLQQFYTSRMPLMSLLTTMSSLLNAAHQVAVRLISFPKMTLGEFCCLVCKCVYTIWWARKILLLHCYNVSIL